MVCLSDRFSNETHARHIASKKGQRSGHLGRDRHHKRSTSFETNENRKSPAGSARNRMRHAMVKQLSPKLHRTCTWHMHAAMVHPKTYETHRTMPKSVLAQQLHALQRVQGTTGTCFPHQTLGDQRHSLHHVRLVRNEGRQLYFL